MRLGLIATLGVALVFASSGCPSKSKSGSSGAAVSKSDHDADVEKLLKESKAEAREWLDGSNHGIFKFGNKRSKELTDELYDLGATEVDVTGITKMGEGELAAIIVAKLPTAKDARGKLIAKYNELYKESGDPELKDEGQKWLEFILD